MSSLLGLLDVNRCLEPCLHLTNIFCSPYLETFCGEWCQVSRAPPFSEAKDTAKHC